MTKRVRITRKIPEAGLWPLREAGWDVEVYEGTRPIPRNELLNFVRGADGLITLVSERVDDELLAAAGPQLEVVANFAVGFNNIDLAACTRHGVVVTNTPDVLTGATADMTLALLLAVARRVVEGDELVRSGRWPGWAPEQLLGLGLEGKALGLVGMGRIGAAVARRALGFGMDVFYHNRSRDPKAEAELGAHYVADLQTLLAECDIVSLHTPLTAETRHLIGEAELRAMKREAILINTARGAVLDEVALVRALRDGVIWGAGLDVFENEPSLTPGLAELPNVVLAPHLGSATRQARDGMARICAASILAVFRGERPAHMLNPGAAGAPPA
ncbi:MAG TPA: D-glycerate dehydrogenase [Trueperaceae bacterium]